ncbi:unnamed protein product [Urochloa humidicola]
MSESAPAQPAKWPRHGQDQEAAPLLPDDVIVEQILTRVPAADTICFQAVCRSWRAALTSDHFVRAYQAVRSAAAAQPPEIAFFAPAATSGSTAFYSSRLNDPTTHQNNGSSPVTARELVTVGNLRAKDVVLSGTKPCRGLTLLFQPGECAYHVINLSTGDHMSLPPCLPPWREIPYGPYVLASAGLGFDLAANEHIVVRFFEDWDTQQHCEVFGLRSGGWRPCAGQAPPHAAKGLDGCPPVFLDGRFYWHIDSSRINFTAGAHQKHEAISFGTPGRILSLSVGNEEFEWVPGPEERARNALHLVELDGALCAVVDARLSMELFEIWTTRTPPGPARPASWSLSIRISLATLPQPARSDMGRGIRMLPLGTLSSGKILLATSHNEVYAYDPGSNTADRVFSVEDFVDDAPGEGGLMLNVALHEESVASVRRRGRNMAASDRGMLKMKLGSSTVVARRGGAAPGGQHRNDLDITPQLIQQMLGATMDQFHDIINMYYE